MTTTENPKQPSANKIAPSMNDPVQEHADNASWGTRLSARIKATVRPLLIGSMRFVLDRPALFQRVSALVKTYPALFGRLKAFAVHRGIIEPELVVDHEDNIAHASVRVVTVYTTLKQAFEEKERG